MVGSLENVPDRVAEPRAPYVTSESTRCSMRHNVSTDTQPELTVRRALWAAGLRGYRKNYKKLPGRPDVVYTRRKVAVFIHGCFWHRCPYCTRNITPTGNGTYWASKFEQNAARDKRTEDELKRLGFTVVVLWECRVKRDIASAVTVVRSAFGAG